MDEATRLVWNHYYEAGLAAFEYILSQDEPRTHEERVSLVAWRAHTMFARALFVLDQIGEDSGDRETVMQCRFLTERNMSVAALLLSSAAEARTHVQRSVAVLERIITLHGASRWTRRSTIELREMFSCTTFQVMHRLLCEARHASI